MPLDPSIFYNFAALRAQDNARLGQTLSNAASAYIEGKKKPAFDVEKMAVEGMYEINATGTTSPEKLNAIKTKADMEGMKTRYTQDPYNPGVLIPNSEPNQFQMFLERAQGAQYTPTFPAMADVGNTAPVGAVSRQPLPSIGGGDDMNFPSIPMDQVAGDMPTPQYGGGGFKMPPALTPQQAAALEARGNPFAGEAAPLPEVKNGLRNPIEGTPLSNIEQMKAAVDLQKEAAQVPLEVKKEVMKTQGVEQAKLEVDKKKTQPKAQASLLDLGSKMQNMNKTIDNAIEQTGLLSAGFVGGLFGNEEKGYAAGTPAANLSATLKTIKADAAFSEIQKMRDNSPTGGALGNTTENELALLSNAQAALLQSQSPEQLRQNLKEYKRIRNESLMRVRDAYAEQYGEAPDLSKYGVPPKGAQLVGTSGGKNVYQLPDGSYVKEK